MSVITLANSSSASWREANVAKHSLHHTILIVYSTATNPVIFSCAREFMGALEDNLSLLDVDLTANLIGMGDTTHVRDSTEQNCIDDW